LGVTMGEAVRLLQASQQSYSERREQREYQQPTMGWPVKNPESVSLFSGTTSPGLAWIEGHETVVIVLLVYL